MTLENQDVGAMTNEKPRTTGSAHTPGPWQSEATGVQPGAFSIIGDGRQMVALIYGATREEQRANARSVAALPDMKVALKNAADALEYCLNNYVEGSDIFRRKIERNLASARAAIAKATGAA